jgi:hypothetical protein
VPEPDLIQEARQGRIAVHGSFAAKRLQATLVHKDPDFDALKGVISL